MKGKYVQNVNGFLYFLYSPTCEFTSKTLFATANHNGRCVLSERCLVYHFCKQSKLDIFFLIFLFLHIVP